MKKIITNPYFYIPAIIVIVILIIWFRIEKNPANVDLASEQVPGSAIANLSLDQNIPKVGSTVTFPTGYIVFGLDPSGCLQRSNPIVTIPSHTTVTILETRYTNCPGLLPNNPLFFRTTYGWGDSSTPGLIFN